MTWIRIDVDFPTHELIGQLVADLRIDEDRALACLVRVWCALATHSPTGDLSAVTDYTLERWANWRGRRGAFAAAFRIRCLEEAGTVKGWWRQQKLLAHQAAKRRRPSQRQREIVRQKSGAGLLPGPAPKQRRYVDEDVDDNDRTAAADAAAVPAAASPGRPDPDYTTRCVQALNAGLADNPDLGRTANPVPASGQVGVVSWQADGIPLDLACRVIEERARAYRPTPRHRQPHGLRYFDAAVREAHELDGQTPEDEDARYARLAAKLQAEETAA